MVIMWSGRSSLLGQRHSHTPAGGPDGARRGANIQNTGFIFRFLLKNIIVTMTIVNVSGWHYEAVSCYCFGRDIRRQCFQ